MVNRGRTLQIAFEIDHWPLASGSHIDGPMNPTREELDAMIALGEEDRGSLRDMLKRPVVVWNGYVISAHEMVKYLANVDGGVHLDQPSTDRERAIASMAEVTFYGGFSGGLMAIAAVGRVVLRSLKPLTDQVTIDLGW